MHTVSRRVTLAMWLVLGFTVWNAVRLATSVAWLTTLAKYEPHPGPIYIGISGALWTVTGLLVISGFWLKRQWTRLALLIASSLYTAWVWVDRLFVQSEARANWPFALVATVVLLAFVMTVALDPHNSAYFERESYGRKP